MNNKSSKPSLTAAYKKHFKYIICKLQSLKHNSRVNITDENGNTISQSSAGQVGYKNNKKRSPSVATAVANHAFKKLIEDYKVVYDSIKIEVKGFGIGRSTLLRAIKKYGKITSITETTGLPHNGVRPPKAKSV